jgi:hypothetical protein
MCPRLRLAKQLRSFIYSKTRVVVRIRRIYSFLSKMLWKMWREVTLPKNRMTLVWIAFLIPSVFVFCVYESFASTPTTDITMGITQILATMFTFIASTSLLAAQLSTRYTGKALDIVFNRRIVLYLLSLAIAVAFSIVRNGGKEVVGLLLLFLFMLGPYFYDLKETLKPETLIREIGKRAEDKFRKLLRYTSDSQQYIEKTFDDMDIVTSGLHDAIMSAYSRYEYDEYEIGLGQLVQLARIAYLKQNLASGFSKTPMFNPPVLWRIRTVGEDVVKNDYACRIFFEKLLKLSREAVDAEDRATTKLILDQLELLASCYVDLGERNKILRIEDFLAELARHATRNSKLQIASDIRRTFDNVCGQIRKQTKSGT